MRANDEHPAEGGMSRGERPRLVAFSGNTHRPSRSRALAEIVAARIQNHLPVDISVCDVLELGHDFAAAFTRAELPPQAVALLAAIEAADILVAVSPVYKGGYTGLFKHLFDFLDVDSLAGKPVVIGATGGGPRHTLVVEHQLRPLFAFFNALTIPTSIYADDGAFDGYRIADPAVTARIEMAARQTALAIDSGFAPQHRAGRRIASTAEPELAQADIMDCVEPPPLLRG